jgi:hypothetical protein
MIINHVPLNMLIDNARRHVELLHEYENSDDETNDIRYIVDMLHGDLDAMTELLARASIDTPKSSSDPTTQQRAADRECPVGSKRAEGMQ